MPVCSACLAVPESLQLPLDSLEKGNDIKCEVCGNSVHIIIKITSSLSNTNPGFEISFEQKDSRGRMEAGEDDVTKFRQKQRTSCTLQVNGQDINDVQYSIMPHLWRSQLPSVKLDASEDETATLRLWLKNCLENHEECRATTDNSQFNPTRLLDVEAFEASSDIRLIFPSPSPTSKMHYLTLSHCWGSGSSSPAITTSQNIVQRMQAIPHLSLPLTLRDAVDHTRNLGFRYLWIDSLCIIQDSPGDWEREASLMGKVYANATCNLAASSSADSHGGCSVGRRETGLEDGDCRFDIDISRDIRIRVYMQNWWKPPVWWYSEYTDGPLRQRAWVLQERELSRRAIHFAQNVILWECKRMRATSQIPWVELEGSNKLKRNIPHELISSRWTEEDPVQPAQRATLVDSERWFSIIQDYSERSLTYESDKLPALSGLAHEIGSGSERYLAGMWEGDFPEALLWRTTALLWLPPRPQRAKEYRAPSWSWASINGRISYILAHLIKETYFGGVMDKSIIGKKDSSIVESNIPETFRILEIDVKSAGIDVMGAVSYGHIILTGCLKRAVLNGADYWADNDFCEGGWRKLWDDSHVANLIGLLSPDVMPERDFRQEVFCLALCRELRPSSAGLGLIASGKPYLTTKDDEEQKIVVGLALVKDEILPDTYRRLGLVRAMRWTAEDDKEPQTIRLI